MASYQYICVNLTGNPLELGHYRDTPKSGVLLVGDHCTIFKNYSAARRAIERSKRYSESKGFDWKADYFRPVRVVHPDEERKNQ